MGSTFLNFNHTGHSIPVSAIIPLKIYMNAIIGVRRFGALVSLIQGYERKNVIEIAKAWVLAGFRVVPLRGNEKTGQLEPAIRWGPLKEKDLSLGEVEELFKSAQGVAVVVGKPSGVVGLDIDSPEKFDRFYPLEKAKQNAGILVESKTPGHLHLYFGYEEKFGRYVSLRGEHGFELKSGGTLMTVFSVIPGQNYKLRKVEGLKPLQEDLKKKLLDLVSTSRWTFKKGKRELGSPFRKFWKGGKKLQDIPQKRGSPGSGGDVVLFLSMMTNTPLLMWG